MSVIVKRDSDNKVFNFIKGADMAIIPIISESGKHTSTKTISCMNQIAAKGYRTLMFAYKELDESLDADQLKDINENELDKDVELLGITGLEDMLQQDVQTCIRDFRNAQIKVWMLTGDKEETAKSIAISAGLID